MALLTCKNLSFSYEGKPVVEGLDLTVNAGDYLCIVGENGSGKSTLVKGLLGLILPSAGSVSFGDGLQKNEMGYLPQRMEAQRDFPASVWEVVTSGCRSILPFLSQKEKEKALNTLKLLSIEDLKNNSFSELSGGQQQRVLLARALLVTRKLLLLDEPTAGLDPLVTRELYDTIEKLHKEEGLTVIMVSHDVEAAVEYADYILHLSHSSAFYGTAAEYAGSSLGKRFAKGGAEYV